MFAVWSEAAEKEGVPNQMVPPTNIARKKTIHGYKFNRERAAVPAGIMMSLLDLFGYCADNRSDR